MLRSLPLSCLLGVQSRLALTTQFVLFAGLFLPSTGYALISGGEGNQAVRDPGWPTGAAEVFNWPTRIAWWEGPPFGGGQWHAECKGDAEVLSQVLAKFVAIDSPVKRVVVRDGLGYSFWLDPNGKKRADRRTKIDWEFSVWQADRWKMQLDLPPSMSALRDASARKAPAVVLTVYTGGLRWNEVKLPTGLDVTDHRLEAHGYDLSDGRVLEGIVSELASGQPMAARVIAQRITPSPEGGYDYEPIAEVQTDASGHWEFKQLSADWLRFIVESEGYAAKVVHHTRYDRQPGWEKVDTQLAKLAQVHGTVVDGNGQPLAGVEVSLRDVVVGAATKYDMLTTTQTLTNAQGQFHLQGIAHGRGRLHTRLSGYIRPGLGMEIEFPANDIELTMTQSASITIHVTFPERRAETAYIVEMHPVGGEKVGSWGGSANLGQDDTVTFRDVPPGRYEVVGHPNPHSARQRTQALQVNLEGGKDLQVELEALP